MKMFRIFANDMKRNYRDTSQVAFADGREPSTEPNVILVSKLNTDMI